MLARAFCACLHNRFGGIDMKISELKKGDFFTVRPLSDPKESQVYVRGVYDRSSRKYVCSRFDDFCSSRLFSGSKEVYTEFTF